MECIDELIQKRLACGLFPYMHACSIFKNNLKCGNVTIGLNSEEELYSGCCYSKHAEMDAIRKLKRKHNKKRIVKVNILVIKTTSTRKLGCSFPCLNCLKHIKKLPEIGYRVKYIYFSTHEGNIDRVKLVSITDNYLYKSKRFRIIK